MTRAENINPSILTWARETAGLSLEEAAHRLGLTATEASTPEEKLQALEEGDKKPTRNQLLKIATVYRRPLTAFYMSAPPVIGDRGEDFRTIAAQVSPKESALLDALLRDIRARQDMVRTLLEEDEDTQPLTFVGRTSIRDNVALTAEAIRQALGIAAARDLRRFNGAEALFNDLRARVENLGVFVLLIGNLGSHQTNISETIFRGFAIADEIAPFIVINDQDAKTARSFTLIHELVHIFVGSTGVSGAPTTIEPATPTGRVERFCNDVAGEFLLPTGELPAPGQIAPGAERAVIRIVAEDWNVSEPMVAYRFQRTGRISDVIYRELVAQYAARWRAMRARQREQNRENENGPSYYVVRKHRLGRALLNFVGRNLRDNSLTHTKAAKVLGVKPSSVEPLLRGADRFGPFAPLER
ncbi:DNA-binding protein [Bosea thiooxidans]|uniref:DNA-binding protein n=1 Tax=Bosea thiooxidans TaxID=53254 RepID=A0A0Q3KQT3_9HYPH|nr:XRE family transcriptional regulator [Bosea thiooxidans]KQK32139.1 DNA-binding protein [Bosea thiooxidans]